MPKIPKNYNISALKKAQKLFNQNQESSSEESCDSDTSEEYSHIPLKSFIPFVDKLSLDESEIERANMEQLNAQLQQILSNIQHIAERQNNQDQRFVELNQKVDAVVAQPSNPNPVPITPRVTENNFENLFRIPDPIKSLPSYDGNRRQLTAWISTARNTLEAFLPHVTENQYRMYTTAVLNKIEGKAKDILCLAGNPQNFDDVEDILTNAIGDRQELSTYKCQLWQNKMDDKTSIHKYYQKTKELVQNIKILAKQTPKYQQNWDAICSFIEEDALAAFISGLRDPYFGHVQAARPKDIEDAYAFLCKFRSQQITANRSEKPTIKYENKNFAPNKSTFNKIDNKSTDKNIHPTNTEKYKPPLNLPVEKMDVDPSIRSRLTLNRRNINNNEIQSDSESDRPQSDNEEDEVTINFCLMQNQVPET